MQHYLKFLKEAVFELKIKIKQQNGGCRNNKGVWRPNKYDVLASVSSRVNTLKILVFVRSV